MARHEELLSHLRHDLIKHLDIPTPGDTLSTAAWEVLQRRLFSNPTGVVTMGHDWTLRLKRAWSDHPLMIESVEGLTVALLELDQLEGKVTTWAQTRAQASALLTQRLDALVDAVHGIHDAARASGLIEGEAPQPRGDDDDATLDFLLGDEETTAPLANAAAHMQPPEEIIMSRVLVVDDRLHAVERFHAMKHMQERFDWVTLCELEGPCWTCPHRDGCGMKRARTFRELESALRRADATGRPIDAVLMDVRFDDVAEAELLPTPAGFEPSGLGPSKALQGPLMVRSLRKRPDLPDVPVVLMTERRGLPPGANKLLEGLEGLHFVEDEASIEALIARVDAVVRRRRKPVTEGAYFWGRSPQMLSVREQLELLSMGPRPILLTGPSGSGKSFLVEEVVLPLSERPHLITIDLSALPETLVEGELFGFVKGSFSGATRDRPGLLEEADGGVLFIDEIGNLSPENQRKLLLFLQNRQVRRIGASHRTKRHVDVKVVVATHLNLQKEVEEGRFRFDLYMRLRPATQVRLPSLKERPEDLDGIMTHLVRRLAAGAELSPLVETVARSRKRAPQLELLIGNEEPPKQGLALRLPDATVEALRAYPWPGNTRELESVLDTLLLRALADARFVKTQGSVLEVDHYLTLQLLSVGSSTGPTTHPQISISIEPSSDLKQIRHRLERTYLVEAFKAAKGDMERMTELVLGSNRVEDRHRLTVRMNQLGLKVSELKMLTS